MIIFKTAGQVENYIVNRREKGEKIGFVPTMGALHAGHLSLIKQSKAENTITVCSIFINPTQFNNKDDFNHYPVTLEKDIQELLKVSCDILFIPSVEEIYPIGYKAKYYDLGRLETLLEGTHRPGHFQGVCQVVDRLLSIVLPNNIYIGQKDYQQCMVIKKLIHIIGKTDDIQINIAPTIRENDGLAMSSRNLRLSKEQRAKAVSIYKELLSLRNNLNKEGVSQLKSQSIKHLEQNGFLVDYVELANADTLEPVKDKKEPVVALIAASLDNIRLIDNLPLN